VAIKANTTSAFWAWLCTQPCHSWSLLAQIPLSRFTKWFPPELTQTDSDIFIAVLFASYESKLLLVNLNGSSTIELLNLKFISK